MFIIRTCLALLVVTALAGASVPPMPATPAPVDAVVAARPFTVEQPFTHMWRTEQSAVDAGYLLVLRVNPDLVYPRQTAEPVLYVGEQTAERVNVGYTDGHVIAIVPTPRDPKTGAPTLDLTRTRIWFGTPRLPESVDAARVRTETELAATVLGPMIEGRPDGPVIAPGVAAVAMARQARAAGGEAAAYTDRAALHAAAAELVLRYAPSETDLAANLAGRRTPGDG